MLRTPNRNIGIAKRLQTELLSLVVFRCFDSDTIFRCGTSAKNNTIVSKLHKFYMHSTLYDNDHMSDVEIVLEGKGKHAGLFERAVEYNDSPFLITKMFHCLYGAEITMKNEYVGKELITR